MLLCWYLTVSSFNPIPYPVLVRSTSSQWWDVFYCIFRSPCQPWYQSTYLPPAVVSSCRGMPCSSQSSRRCCASATAALLLYGCILSYRYFPRLICFLCRNVDLESLQYGRVSHSTVFTMWSVVPSYSSDMDIMYLHLSTQQPTHQPIHSFSLAPFNWRPCFFFTKFLFSLLVFHSVCVFVQSIYPQQICWDVLFFTLSRPFSTHVQ